MFIRSLLPIFHGYWFLPITEADLYPDDNRMNRRSASWECVQVGHRRIQEICQLGMCPSWTPSDPGDLPAGNVSKLDTIGSRRSASWECVQVGHYRIQEICRPGMCPSWTPSDPGELPAGKVVHLDYFSPPNS